MSREIKLKIMNKSHATIYLVSLMGASDGEWTKKEMRSALLLGTLKSAVEEAPDWGDKVQSLELNETSAIDILNQESKEVQMQCLINILLTAFADGVIDDGEKNVLVRIISKLNKGITVEELIDAHMAHLDSLR